MSESSIIIACVGLTIIVLTIGYIVISTMIKARLADIQSVIDVDPEWLKDRVWEIENRMDDIEEKVETKMNVETSEERTALIRLLQTYVSTDTVRLSTHMVNKLDKVLFELLDEYDSNDDEELSEA